MNDALQAAIIALLPISALATVLQTKPYNALIGRGMLGTVAALIYAMLGAPDVALTEALIGTFLTILLYAIAVRSSMVLRMGWTVQPGFPGDPRGPTCDITYEPIRRFCAEFHLSPRFQYYEDNASLGEALVAGHIDAVYARWGDLPEALFRCGCEDSPDVEQRIIFLAEHAGSLQKKLERFLAGEHIPVFRAVTTGSDGVV